MPQAAGKEALDRELKYKAVLYLVPSCAGLESALTPHGLEAKPGRTGLYTQFSFMDPYPSVQSSLWEKG